MTHFMNQSVTEVFVDWPGYAWSVNEDDSQDIIETSLLRRLQAQTLPNEAPPIGKMHPFGKMAVNFQPLMGF